MWCANCKADVAAQVSTETERVTCAVCGIDLAHSTADASPSQDARAILERWSRRSILDDPFGPIRPSPEASSNVSAQSANASTDSTQNQTDTDEPSTVTDRQHEEETTVASDESSESPSVESEPVEVGDAVSAVPPPKSGRKMFRIDGAQGIKDIAPTAGDRQRTEAAVNELRYRDDPHRLRAPHFAMRTPERKSNLNVLAGQWLSYIGVLGLTIGTATVVYGYFGGYTSYTPTGWLITTVGQMLLFLGVINLVSGGMEQSSDEVAQRIEILGEHILRIEQATSEQTLRGPKIPIARFENPNAAPETANERELAGVERPDMT